MSTRHGYMYRLWEEGQRHLAAGRYVAACGALEAASDLACRGGDMRSLARLYLPLLEARRLMRYRAAEGRIVIVAGDAAETRGAVKRFYQAQEGTLVVTGAERAPGRALRLARAVNAAARRTGCCLEALLVLEHGDQARLAAAGDATFAAGVPVVWTPDAAAAVGAATDSALVVPLPAAGEYDGQLAGWGAVARESLVIAWEALALRWQSRHRLPAGAGPWEELRWLRAALRVDPACEPVTMRLIAVAEGLERGGGR